MPWIKIQEISLVNNKQFKNMCVDQLYKFAIRDKRDEHIIYYARCNFTHLRKLLRKMKINLVISLNTFVDASEVDMV